MAKPQKLNDEQVEELRKAIWAKMSIATPLMELDADDIRRTEACSNSKSPHCPGGKATHRRAGKVLCEVCAARTGKARARIEARAEARLKEVVEGVNSGKQNFDTALAAWV